MSTLPTPTDPTPAVPVATGEESPVAEIREEGSVLCLIVYTSKGRMVTALSNVKKWSLRSAQGASFRGELTAVDNRKVRQC